LTAGSKPGNSVLSRTCLRNLKDSVSYIERVLSYPIATAQTEVKYKRTFQFLVILSSSFLHLPFSSEHATIAISFGVQMTPLHALHVHMQFLMPQNMLQFPIVYIHIFPLSSQRQVLYATLQIEIHKLTHTFSCY
jgi:hypothetical protein